MPPSGPSAAPARRLGVLVGHLNTSQTSGTGKELQLWGSQGSRAWRSLWMIRELGLEDQVEMIDIPIDLRTGNIFPDDPSKATEFSKINPNKRMPALIDTANNFKIFESSAISIYLAKRQESTLGPADLQEDALMTQWAIWVHCYVEANVIDMFFGNMRKKPEKRKEIVSRCMKDLERPLKALEAALEGKEYLVAERFTAADLTVSANILFGGQLVTDFTDMVKSEMPNVAAWLRRCTDRPAYIPQ